MSDGFKYIRAPNGDELRFPESMDDAAIADVIRREFPSTSATGAALRGLGQGLTFGTSDEGVAAIGALYDKLTGAGDFGDSYNKRVTEQRAMLKADSQQHPWASIGGEIAGSFAIPFGVARTGYNAVRAGMPLAQAMRRGAAEGAAYGAAYGAGKSEGGLQNRAEGAAGGAVVGGAIGGAAVPVVRGLASGAQGVVNRVNAVIDPEREAARRLAQAQALDHEAHAAATSALGNPNARVIDDAQSLIAQGRAGDELRNVDMVGGGSNTRALMRSAANNSPQAREILEQMTDQRFASQATRVEDFLRQQGLSTGNTATFSDDLANAARQANADRYRPAMEAGDRPIWSDTLERLTGSPSVRQAMQRAEQTGKDRAIADGYGAMNTRVQFDQSGRLTFSAGPEGVPTYPNLAYWDAVKRELDDMAGAARRAGEDSKARDLTALTRQLRSELDQAVPQYGAARAEAAGWFQAENALEAGTNFARGSVRLTADQAERALAQMSQAERAMFREGYANELLRQIQSAPDRRNVVSLLAGSNDARRRLELAVGPQAAREIEAFAYIEMIMDLPRRALGNSTTVRQLAELSLAGGAGFVASGGNMSDPAAWLTGALVYGARRGQAHLSQDMARRIAEMLVSRDPQIMQQALQQVSQNPGALQGLRNLARGISQGARAASGNVAGSTMSQPLEVTIDRGDAADNKLLQLYRSN